jgi:hypothetical protein
MVDYKLGLRLAWRPPIEYCAFCIGIFFVENFCGETKFVWFSVSVVWTTWLEDLV